VRPTDTYRLKNSGSATLAVYLEPWGGEYSLAPGEEADLRAAGPSDHPLHWEVGDGKLVVFSLAEAGSSLTLWRDGVEIPPR
jgi:hypothetical protein